MKITARFDVISRTVTTYGGDVEAHSLKLLHKPLPSSPEPWWQHPAAMDYQVPASFAAKAGDAVIISIELAV